MTEPVLTTIILYSLRLDMRLSTMLSSRSCHGRAEEEPDRWALFKLYLADLLFVLVLRG